MTLLALMAQSSGSQLNEIARTFGVDWPHLTAQIISFSIVCALLYFLAYQPVLRMLEQRRQQIAQGIANTEKINAKLASIEAERKSIIAAAQADGGKVIAEARDVAARLKARETERAVATAGEIIAKARDAAALEHTRMLADLRREVGRLVVKTTAAVTGKILTSDDQKRLADESVRQLS